ncbi:hypothetical protein J6590_038628 [Homalodisca vitripennis]|nr:hypothetical protein J6590_038628 [Homalodisca vitripennis]
MLDTPTIVTDVAVLTHRAPLGGRTNSVNVIVEPLPIGLGLNNCIRVDPWSRLSIPEGRKLFLVGDLRLSHPINKQTVTIWVSVNLSSPLSLRKNLVVLALYQYSRPSPLSEADNIANPRGGVANSSKMTRSVWVTLLLLILTGAVKAHIHFLRMVILAAAGLAGMYMVHLLAQDWTKIRPNRPAATRLLQQALQGISKRSIPDEIVDDSLNEIPTWDSALEQDPLGCARKLVCTLATRPRSSLRTEETNILAMVRLVK